MMFMITEELLEFLRTQYASGMSAEEMEHLLVSEGGWNKEDVDEAFRQVGITPIRTETPEPELPTPEPTPVPETATAPLPPAASAPLDLPVEALSVLPPPESVLPEVAPMEEVLPPVAVVEQTPVDTPVEAPASLDVEVAPLSLPEETTIPPAFSTPIEAAVPEESAPITDVPPSTPADDDFLGLFSAPTEESLSPAPIVAAPQATDEPPVTPSPVAPPPAAIPPAEASLAEIPSLVAAIKEDTPALPPTPVAPTGDEFTLDDVHESITDIAAQVPGISIAPAPTPAPASPVVAPATPPAPLVFGKKPEWSFQDLLAQKTPEAKVEPVESIPPPVLEAPLPTPVEQETPPAKSVQFDLSRIGKTTDAPTPIATQFPDPARVSSTPAVKPVETRSVAEVWLAGANPEAKEPVPYTSSTPRSGLNTRRTMNSDLLLRGKGGTTVAAMPAITDEGLPSPVAMPEIPVPPPAPAPVKRSPAVPTEASLAESLKRKNQLKRIAGVVVGVLVLAGMVWGAVSYILSHRGPSLAERFTLSLTQFVGLPSFSYAGDGFLDLTLSTSQGGVARDGSVKFTLRDSGMLQNSANGFGDGAHRVKVATELRSGTYLWNTDVESDVLMIGNALYFHLLSYPAASDFDPAVAQTYWVKVDMDALAQELAISGVSNGTQGYGSFGTGKADSSWNTLYAKHLPFVVDEALPDETLNGVSVMHVKLKSDPDRMLAFALVLYKKYSGSDLLLTADQQLRLKNALAKVTGEAWIDPTTNTLLKVTVRGEFDDDMVSAHVKGTAQFTFAFADQGKTVSVTPPTPFLTLEEFRARTDEYKQNKELRAGDTVKLDGMKKIIDALAAYQKEKGRYPTTLLDLRSSGKLPASVVDDFAFKSYSYAAYLKPEQLTKAGRCPVKGKTCAFYHLGVSFEDLTNPALASDADTTSEILGKDASGCLGEPNVACFDVVSTSLSPAPVATSSTATTTAR